MTDVSRATDVTGQQSAQPAGTVTRAAAGVPAAAPATAAPRKVRTRRVRSTVVRLDPWSVMKVSFVLAVGLGIALVVMAALLWILLSAAGVIGSIDQFVADLTGSQTFRFADLVSLRRVLGFGLVLAALEAVLLTALATLGAFLYNITVGLVGGIEATVSEEE